MNDSELESLLREGLRTRDEHLGAIAPGDVLERVRRRRRRSLIVGGAGTVAMVALVAVAAMVAGTPGLTGPTTGGSGAAGWTPLAPLPAARTDLAAVVGADGRVYVFGGATASGPVASVDVFDPASGRWSSRAPMAIARAALAAALGPDGRIYVFGGWSKDGVLDSVEVYTPGADRWEQGAPLPEPLAFFAAAPGADGRIFVFGGFGQATAAVGSSAVYAYDPGSDTWTARTPMPTGRAYVAAASGPDGSIYVLGGKVDDAHSYVSTVEAYDPAHDAWTEKTPMSTTRNSHGATRGPGGKIYAIGGFGGPSGAALPTIEAYDPASNTWTQEQALPEGRAGLAAVMLGDGSILAIGGCCTGEGVPATSVLALRPSASVRSPAPLVVEDPQPGVFLLGPLPVDVVGGQADGLTKIRASVSLGDTELGSADIDVDANGRFRGMVPILPPRERSWVDLRITDLASGRELARVTFGLEVAGLPIMIWTPARPHEVVTRPKLKVTGATLDDIDWVRVRLETAGGRVLDDRTAPTSSLRPGWRGYAVEMRIPGDAPPGEAWLTVTWRDPASGAEAAGVQGPVLLPEAPPTP